ncbi:hypothetical protein [Phytohabitans houttuyneae]|uniref:hypothetical protein n=1 Tax=Phytohabitans houttuyneae TaxID=1076126 RepID=UPI001C49B928|nr:hypothetical protein [Phytohabitans houttuyneae]
MTRHTRLLQFTALASTLDRFAMPPMLLAISRDLDIPVSGWPARLAPTSWRTGWSNPSGASSAPASA